MRDSKRQPSESVKLIERAIGGHPRTLEYLDALLRNGVAQLPAVQDRLNQFAKRAGISLAAPSGTRGACAGRHPGGRRRCNGRRTGASHQPTTRPLSHCSGRPRSSRFPSRRCALYSALARAPIDPAALAAAITVSPDLLTRLEGHHMFVHRWTAESLKSRHPGGDLSGLLHASRGVSERRAPSRCPPVGGRPHRKHPPVPVCRGQYDRAAELGGQLILRLEPYGQTTVWTDLARELGRPCPTGTSDKLRFIDQKATDWRSLGFTDQAMELLRPALEIAERQSSRSPIAPTSSATSRSPTTRWAICTALSARATPRASSIRRPSKSPSDSSSRSPIAPISSATSRSPTTRMGDLHRALGQGDSARQFYQKALEIAERLVQQEPDRADYLRDLSVSYNRMGDLHARSGPGRLPRASSSQGPRDRRATGAAGARSRRFPPRPLGLLQQDGRPAPRARPGRSARQFYHKALEIPERLVQQEPDRADYLRDLSVSYEQDGRSAPRSRPGRLRPPVLQKALEIRERLVSRSPIAPITSATSRSPTTRWAICTALSARAMPPRQFYPEGSRDRRATRPQEPDRADYLRDLSVSYNKLGDLARLGQGDAAAQFFEKALEIAERLVARSPTAPITSATSRSPTTRWGICAARWAMAMPRVSSIEKALEIAERLVAAGARARRLPPRPFRLLQQAGGSGARSGPWRCRPSVL